MKPYVIRRVRPLALVPLAGLVAIVAFVVVLDFDVLSPVYLVGIAALLAFYEVWRRTLVLRVDADGVRLTSVTVPWSSIEEIALTETDPPEIEVRLKHGAPLPQGVHGAVHDPTRPYVSAPQLRAPAPDADRTQLTAAVEGFGAVPLRSA